MSKKDDFEFLQGLAMCDDKEQMMRYIQEHAPKIPTNADRLRSMSDEELAQMLNNGLDSKYCTNDPTCGDLLDTDGGIPEEKCIACALRWLRQPVKEAKPWDM